ncbi:MAG: LysR family transcriptional regulator [Rhizobiales bacterium]|nr:LysR family transcriptional regulator [Hyphomicrobiales bacterium]
MDVLKTMDSFVLVVRTGSFAGAAEQFGVSRAIVSKHIQLLEEHLGARLLNRSTRRLSLTEIGRSYHAFCIRILGQIEEQKAAVASLQNEPRGTLRVMAPKSFGNLYVGSAISDFVARYPQIKVSLLLQDGSLNSHDLIDNGVDLAIRLSPVADSSAIAKQIGSSRWLLCATPGYLAAHGEPQIPDDLLHHNCLVHTKSAPDNVWSLEDLHDAAHVTVDGSFAANSALALRAAALKGLGIAMLPLYSISTDLATRQLVQVLPDFLGPERPIIALYPHRPLLLTKVRLLVDFLSERFKQAPVSYADYTRQNGSDVTSVQRRRKSVRAGAQAKAAKPLGLAAARLAR